MRRCLIFLLLTTMMLRSLSSSELSATSPNGHVPKFYMFLSMPPDPDVTLVSALDGTIHFVDTKLEKILWSSPTARSIYSSYQASFITDSELYIDVDEAWELYFYTKRGGKMKKLSSSVEEYIGGMPYISKDGGVTVGAMRITVFLVDAKSGRVVDSYVADSWASTSGFQSDDNQHVLPVEDYKEFVESSLGNLKTVRQMFYITRTDYVLQSTSRDSGEILWNVTYTDIKAELRCLEMGKSFSGYHFDSGSELRTNLIGDVESLLPCQPHMRTSVYRLRDNNLSEFLSVIGKEGEWISLPISHRNPLFGPVPRKLHLPLPDKVDRPLLALPSIETEIPWTLRKPGGSVSKTNNRHSFAEGFRSYITYFLVSLIALCLVIGFLFYHSKQDKLKKHIEEPIIKTGISKKTKSRRQGHYENTTSSEKMLSFAPNESKVGESNALPYIKGNEEKICSTTTDPIDDYRIGKLVVSNKEIAKGRNGTVVLEGNYDGRAVAVKRILMMHEYAIQPIRYVTDRDANIVRYYGKESDEDFVYLSLERCTCSLHDLIPASFGNKLKAKGQYSNLLEGVELWKANYHPSPQLLKLMRDIISGLYYLHGENIVHRDLKPQNVLIIKDKSVSAKISNMGITKYLHVPDGNFATGWQAPEIHQGNPPTTAADMFALGCVLFFCITGGEHHPYGKHHERIENIRENKRELLHVEDIPEAKYLLERLLDPNPDLRPKAEDILNHPMFWTSNKKISFLRLVSEWIQHEGNSQVQMAIEGIATFKGTWNKKINSNLIKHSQKYRQYDFTCVCDLLRIIRNQSTHYSELPEFIQKLLGSYPDEFYLYYSMRFPKLLTQVFYVILKYCPKEELFHEYIC